MMEKCSRTGMKSVRSEKTIEIVGVIAVNVHMYAPYYMRGVW
jgi:hypothetical protein